MYATYVPMVLYVRMFTNVHTYILSSYVHTYVHTAYCICIGLTTLYHLLYNDLVCTYKVFCLFAKMISNQVCSNALSLIVQGALYHLHTYTHISKQKVSTGQSKNIMCLPSCCKSKHLVPKVITGTSSLYAVHLARPFKLDTLPLFLDYELLLIGM